MQKNGANWFSLSSPMPPPPPPLRSHVPPGGKPGLGKSHLEVEHSADLLKPSIATTDIGMDCGMEAVEVAETEPLPGFLPRFNHSIGGSASSLDRRGENSEGPSESSTNIDTEDDDFMARIPHLERFYEELAAKAKLPERNGASTQSWMLSLARSYRRLSREKRRRGGLRALLQPSSGHGFSSGTDDSGYEAGYETDADESEFSEWENGSAPQRQQRHKRKLDALVNLTMKLTVSEGMHGPDEEEHPPNKTHRALGTQPVGLRLSLPKSLMTRDSDADNRKVESASSNTRAMESYSDATLMEVG